MRFLCVQKLCVPMFFEWSSISVCFSLKRNVALILIPPPQTPYPPPSPPPPAANTSHLSENSQNPPPRINNYARHLFFVDLCTVLHSRPLRFLWHQSIKENTSKRLIAQILFLHVCKPMQKRSRHTGQVPLLCEFLPTRPRVTDSSPL